jgi:small ubiquitin-related modifier
MGEEEDQKPETHINIKVASNDNEVHFRIKRTTPLSKLMNSYCERQGKTPGSVRFMLDGQRLEEHNTPEELDMDDGDTIE